MASLTILLILRRQFETGMTEEQNNHQKRSRQARTIRLFRKIHRQTAILLMVAFLIMAITGVMLGWKKNAGSLLLAPTQTGTSSNLEEWLPISQLAYAATVYMRDSIPGNKSAEIDRIDVRPSKGIVKFSFTDHYTGLQVDGATGRILLVEQRRSDLIEHIHDGTLADRIFPDHEGWFKLIYTTIMGLALLLFVITGFWIWAGPKRMKRTGKYHHKT